MQTGTDNRLDVYVDPTGDPLFVRKYNGAQTLLTLQPIAYCGVGLPQGTLVDMPLGSLCPVMDGDIAVEVVANPAELTVYPLRLSAFALKSLERARAFTGQDIHGDGTSIKHHDKTLDALRQLLPPPGELLEHGESGEPIHRAKTLLPTEDELMTLGFTPIY
jgi:hypothetical protein